MVQRIGLGQLRNSASHYFDRVAAGESFDVVRRGRLVARITPLSVADQESSAVETGLLATDGGALSTDGDGDRRRRRRLAR